MAGCQKWWQVLKNNVRIRIEVYFNNVCLWYDSKKLMPDSELELFPLYRIMADLFRLPTNNEDQNKLKLF